MSELKTIEHDDLGGAKKKSPLMAIIPVVVMGILAGASGWGVSQFVILPKLDAGIEASIMQQGKSKTDEKTDKDDAVLTNAEDAAKLSIIPVEPIVTNLAEPKNVWVRAEFAILVRAETAPAELSAQFQNDTLAYLKTVKIQNLEGSSAFQHLLEDVTEIARLNNPDLVDRVLVRSFILE